MESRYDTRSHTAKPVLKRVCGELVGSDVPNWPKVGFATPEWSWLKGPLAPFVNEYLTPNGVLADLLDLSRLPLIDDEENKQAVFTMMSLGAVLSLAKEIQ
jgi:hypothetical protein